MLFIFVFYFRISQITQREFHRQQYQQNEIYFICKVKCLKQILKKIHQPTVHGHWTSAKFKRLYPEKNFGGVRNAIRYEVSGFPGGYLSSF